MNKVVFHCFVSWTFIHILVCRELQYGIPITDENDNRLGESTKAAQQAISQVVVSRILMASPGMGRDDLLTSKDKNIST